MTARRARRSLAHFVLVRLAATVVLLLVLSFVVFSLLHLMPGDPARNLVGVREPSDSLVASIRAKYHLDQPFLEQYWHWLTGVFRGDFGRSIRTDETVTRMLADRVALTFQLAVMAFVLTVAVAVPAGIAAARRAGTAIDRALSVSAVVGVGAPSFAVGLLLLYLFSYRFDVLPGYGSGDGLLDRGWHLVLPAVTLAFGLGALVFKLTRTAVLAELRQDYVSFAISRGLEAAQVRRIVLRNAMIPVVTSLGLMFAFLFGGTILVEVTFALRGIGGLLADSVTFKDLPVVQAVTLLTAAVIALTALTVDLVYLVIDPRVRTRETS